MLPLPFRVALKLIHVIVTLLVTHLVIYKRGRVGANEWREAKFKLSWPSPFWSTLIFADFPPLSNVKGRVKCIRCKILPIQFRLFIVLYFPVRSSRSSALRFGLHLARRPPPRYIWKSRWPSLTIRRAISQRSHEKIGDCEQSISSLISERSLSTSLSKVLSFSALRGTRRWEPSERIYAHWL